MSVVTRREAARMLDVCEATIDRWIKEKERFVSGLDVGRKIKAKRIAQAIRSLGGGAYEARRLTDAEWLLADKLSRQQTGMGVVRIGKEDRPPSEVTRALVIEYLEIDPPLRDEDAPPK